MKFCFQIVQTRGKKNSCNYLIITQNIGTGWTKWSSWQYDVANMTDSRTRSCPRATNETVQWCDQPGVNETQMLESTCKPPAT